VKSLAFDEARLKLIAENVANAETPGYRTKHLNVAAFRASLREALEARRSDPAKPFEVRAGREVRMDTQGNLQVTPTEKPVDHVLFHDGTNVSIERQMADLAETGLMHDLATRLLKERMDGLRKAIRGTV
jgi:flagellar basal-body rod protein FlgB